MYYHASPIANITKLEPRISNHGIPLIYLSNAIEKHCRKTEYAYDGIWENGVLMDFLKIEFNA